MPYTGNAATRLAAIQASIDQIISGAQEYSIRDRRSMRARLDTLRAIEKDLEVQVQLESQGQVASVGVQVPIR